ncbi:MAG: LptF/LptG family permease, partial [Bacteroidota bacterium]|nr:LptF/LptG family permease [Bacteroidota bacterium]
MILYRYILKNHIGPFLFSLLTLIFVFLFNFLTKFADRLVGKGLGFWIITKLIVYNLAWMVVLVVPMSILVATLMAYG